MEMKALCDGMIGSTLMYGRKTQIWNEAKRSRIQTVEMKYLRGVWCEQDGENNGSVYE